MLAFYLWLNFLMKLNFGQLFFPSGHKTLKAHTEEFHPEPGAVQSWPCGDCSAVFKKKSGLTDHRRRMHVSDDAKQFKCSYCGKGFIKKTPLDVHIMSVHIKTRPHACR